jgi:glycosyltransferase involved in cell wall biosynthesis
MGWCGGVDLQGRVSWRVSTDSGRCSVRILELGKFYPPERGGIETLLRQLSEGFVEQGAEVDCVVGRGRTFQGSFFKPGDSVQRGVRIHRLRTFCEFFRTSMAPGYLWSSRRWRSDVIHAHFPNPAADLACLLAPREIPIVLGWHSDICIPQRSLIHLYSPMQRALLRRVDRVVVATPNHLEFSDWLPEFRHKVVVIPYGLDLERFQLSPDQMGRVAELRNSAGGRSILLSVGRLVGYKGQRHAVEALRHVANAELWLVGSGPLESELRTLAADVGVADRVRFFTDVGDADLPLYFKACDVFVFPSTTAAEGFGLVQVEAMACGKPLVTSNVRSGVTYVCSDGVNGLVVPIGDSAALAAALNRLLSTPELAQRLGEVGRERAFSEFSSPVMIQGFMNLFRSLTTQPRKACA